MRILITGASGFIGARAAQHLSARGHAVRCILRRPLTKALAAEPMIGNFADPQFLSEACANIELIVHCAGLAGIWGNRHEYIEANVGLTRRLAEAATRRGVKQWVQLSSPSIYFEFRDQLNIPESYVPANFSSYYAESKFGADRVLFDEFKDAFATIALRPRLVLGAGDQQIIPRMLRFLRAGVFPLVGSGQQTIDVTNVGNLCAAIERCLNAPPSAWNEIYNISNAAPVRYADLVAELQRRLHSHAKILRIPAFVAERVAQAFRGIEKRTGFFRANWPHPVEVAVMTHSMTLDTRKAQAKLGFAPDKDFCNALAEYNFAEA